MMPEEYSKKFQRGAIGCSLSAGLIGVGFLVLWGLVDPLSKRALWDSIMHICPFAALILGAVIGLFSLSNIG